MQTAINLPLLCVCVCRALQTAGMETDDLQAQLGQLQQLIADEEQKRSRQKVPIIIVVVVVAVVYIFLSCHGGRNFGGSHAD